MDDFKLKVAGIAELKHALFSYNQKLGARVAQLAVRNGANFMLKQIRAAAPVKTGRLKRAIKVKSSRINRIAKNGSVGVYITINPGKKRNDPKGAWYGKFVEAGHNTVGSSSGASKNKKRTMVTSKQRGRVDGKHFVLNTFNSTKEQVANIVIDSFELAGKRVAQELGLKSS